LDVRDLVRDAEEISRKIVRKQYRLTLAKYYLLWSTLSVVIELAYGILSYIHAPNLAYYFVIPIIYVPYLFVNFNLFRKAGQVYKRLALTFKSSEEKESTLVTKSKVIQVTVPFLYSLSFLLIYFGITFSNLYITGIGALMFSVLFSVGLVRVTMLAGLKYYDLMASVSLIALTLNLVLPKFYLRNEFYLVSFIFTIIWIFASYKSFIEVIEGE